MKCYSKLNNCLESFNNREKSSLDFEVKECDIIIDAQSGLKSL